MTDSTPPVRLATPDHYTDVARCMAAFRDFLGDTQPTNDQLTAGAYHALTTNQAEYIIAGDPAHSYIQLRYIWSAWHLKDICWIEDVYVDQHHRGQGIGKAMMNHAIQRATDRGCHRLQLDANENNKPATALYQSNGFTHHNNSWNNGRDLYWTKQLPN